MVLNANINVKPEKLSSGLSAALRICNAIAENPDDDIVLDFAETSFITPTFVLPLLIYTKRNKKKITFRNLNNYMTCIHLDSLGINSGEMRKSEFSAFMESFAEKGYIPIVCFPATKDRVDDKDNIISTVESILTKQSKLESNILTGIKYMIAEIVDNIIEHSYSAEGYIFAQCYPTHGYIDICIGDTGITLLGSYANKPNCEICSDAEAMRAANSGISTKNRPEAENRGYGIKTSKRMLINGLGGQYMMLSGNTTYGKTPKASGYLELPGKIRFEGTIVALRIPLNNNDIFRYIEYVE